MEKTPVTDLFNEVSDVINQMKSSGAIPPVRVKSCLEHLRSSLEYLANDIYKLLGNGTTDNIYFPYGKPAFIQKYLSRLNANPETIHKLSELITSIQPYHSGDEWLTMMCNLTNDAKHRHPIPLDQEDVITSRDISVVGLNLIQIAGENSGRVEFKNNKLNGMPIQDFIYDNEVMTTSGTGIPVNLRLTKEEKIKFHGHDYEVIPFLEKCLNELKSFTDRGYNYIRDLT